MEKRLYKIIVALIMQVKCMRNLFLIAIAGLMLLSGCTQIAENAGNQLETCAKKCNEICGVLVNSSVDLEGYDQIQIEKKEGSLTVYCGCTCS